MKIKVKYEILIAGLYLNEEFSEGDFKYKIKNIDKRKKIIPDELVYFNPLLGYYLYPGKKKRVSYSYFDYEKEFTLNISLDNFKKLSKIGQNQYIDEQDLYVDIYNLEKELCLRTNNNIKFPIIRAIIFDEFGKEITRFVEIEKLNIPPYLAKNVEIIKRKIENQKRLNKWVDPNSITEAQNKFLRFNRALKFYYSAMSTNEEATAFILLMSSLESLFNIKSGKKCPECHIDRYDVTKTVSEYVGKILNDKDDIIVEKIRNLYILRSNYIHGLKDTDIIYENEIELREYVRKVLLIYWFIIIRNPNLKSDEEIIKLIDSNKLYDVEMSIFTSTIF